jgi:hypothetical protein
MSEKIGCALNLCLGMMEYWNVGILGMAELGLFLYGWHRTENKIRASSAFGSQYSIFPPFHHSTIPLEAQAQPYGVKPKPGSLGLDSLLDENGA